MLVGNANLDERSDKRNIQNMTKLYKDYMEASNNYLFSGIVDHESSTFLQGERNKFDSCW